MTTQYGSYQNMQAANFLSKPPEVGSGATILMWSDRHAATVIAVSASGKKVTIQEDKATRADGNGRSDAQSYTFEPDTNGATHEVSLRKDGRWKIARSDTVVLLGSRSHYYDYSF